MTGSVTARPSVELRRRAADLFPGGVNSPVRAFRAVGAEPIVLSEGDGARVRDVDGRWYIDCIGGWGPAILGHRHPAVVEAIRREAGQGFALGLTGPLEIELGERIRERMPSMERLRFTSSGTEAVMSAVRLARAATGRDLIVKFAGGYHGHSDGLLVEAGSGLATQAIPGSAGVPAAVAAGTIVLPYNDPAAAGVAFRTHPERIAAVVVEPVAANVGVVAPARGFLEELRELTARDGALLVFDEVITGLRVARGGAQDRFGIRPDLTTLGKIIGGGMPIGAYGGQRDLMALVAPDGPVYQAGTLSGHALSMAAGIATLDALDDAAYERLETSGARLAEGLASAARATGQTVAIARVGSLLTVFFADRPPRDAAESLAGDRDAFGRFFRAMLERGVLVPPSPFESWFVSLAHHGAVIDETLEAARAAFAA
ncbi:MAG TPA: glutamate-1-semialdehyde 2,1-aminomutase [Candidatus Limnocylindrales bacterium]|nr:glutamate-1-semialdehyde 2,1-aminomutase [Candidatus Limnocylindrales bacterium]